MVDWVGHDGMSTAERYAAMARFQVKGVSPSYERLCAGVAEDAAMFGGELVDGPLDAYYQADIINHHALDSSGGKTYAELDREDPVRATMMNASFLRTSLFTSVVSFGVSAFAIGMGILSGLFGWAILTLAPAWPKKITATGVRA